jgi:hypothetical protein
MYTPRRKQSRSTQMNTRSISVTNLETGEIFNTDLKFNDNRFIKRGRKMYSYSIHYLIDNCSKTELKTLMYMFESQNIDYFNILKHKWSSLVPNGDSYSKSKFKKKLKDKNIVQEYNKKIMLNPYIFIPIGDKNIRNSQWLTQKVWTYLFEDTNIFTDEIHEHAELVFGKEILR